MTDSTRSYRSPLREAQAGQTRVLILDTFSELVAAGLSDGTSVREIAAGAGVSERTVYRYFPDRGALLEGLAEWLTERMGVAPIEAALEDADQIVEIVPEIFGRFDAEADVARAALLMNPDPAHPTEDARTRTEMIGGLIERSFPELSAADQHRLHALARTLLASATWLRMREEFGLSGRESGAIVRWALALAFAEIRRNGSMDLSSST